QERSGLSLVDEAQPGLVCGRKRFVEELEGDGASQQLVVRLPDRRDSTLAELGEDAKTAKAAAHQGRVLRRRVQHGCWCLVLIERPADVPAVADRGAGERGSGRTDATSAGEGGQPVF